ncbi:hypothetical protein HYC85_030577 [Camellia sinensis]|uniref:Uncharacterized protein n=1 Tax=Camellia sinensis TaxID=4442 RepID=A0A7J7G563_CAMSI|nr:hypothetical protein HYC85_030577 [Camellia sinensis]
MHLNQSIKTHLLIKQQSHMMMQFGQMRNGSDRIRMLHELAELRLPSGTCTKSSRKDPGGGVPS